MKRMFVLLLGLVILGGCGPLREAAPGTVATKAEATMEKIMEATKEEPITANPNGWKTPNTLALSDAITVYEVYNPALGAYDVWLRDKDTGEEALLLESHVFRGIVTIELGKKINERYFSFEYQILESDSLGESFYDVQKRCVIPVNDAVNQYFYVTDVKDGKVYMEGGFYGDVPLQSTLFFEISALESGEPVVVKTME